MNRSPLSLTLVAALLLATAACAPKVEPASRLSTGSAAPCAFSPDTCADLHSARASIW
jgi:hypothetical protein